jgi:hypothetical protein
LREKKEERDEIRKDGMDVFVGIDVGDSCGG